MQNILTTENLEIGFRQKSNVSIASGVNIHFEKEKLYSVIGANGAGKSTLLRTLTGLQKSLSGKIFIDGIALEKISDIERAKKIAVVLTEKINAANLNVYELIALGRQPYTNWLGKLSAEDNLAVEVALGQTNTENLKHKICAELSDGQLQKVMIARAIAQNSEIIILDEPTTHLDIAHKFEVFQLLKNIAKNGKCVILSTHDIELALELSNEIVLVNNGKVKQFETAELLNSGILSEIFQDKGIIFDSLQRKFVYR